MALLQLPLPLLHAVLSRVEFLLLSCSPAVALQSRPGRCWSPSTSCGKRRHRFPRPLRDVWNSPGQAARTGLPPLPSSCLESAGIRAFSCCVCSRLLCCEQPCPGAPQELCLLQTFEREFHPKLHGYPNACSDYICRCLDFLFLF